jgi:hypothetical protein
VQVGELQDGASLLRWIAIKPVIVDMLRLQFPDVSPVHAGVPPGLE